jgi:hypothetical protein
MKMVDLIVWVADVGSVSQGNFGWCRAVSQQQSVDVTGGTDILGFAKGIAKDLSAGKKIALGFECPLFVPVTDDPQLLTKARPGEANRSWSAAAGLRVLAVGLTECVWVFVKIYQLAQVPVQPTVDWTLFISQEANLFIWEAFVSKESKGTSHEHDAEIAARTFWSKYPKIIEANAVTAQNPYSLVGSALLRAGLTTDLSMLSRPCIVIKS